MHDGSTHHGKSHGATLHVRSCLWSAAVCRDCGCRCHHPCCAAAAPPVASLKPRLPLPLPLLLQLAGGELAELSREVKGIADPDISRAAGGGGLGQEEAEESDQDSGPSSSASAASSAGAAGSDPSLLHRAQQARWQQQRRRTRLPETDYRDGAGI